MNYIPYNSNIITQRNCSTIVNIIKQLPLNNLTNFKLKQLRLLYNSTRDGYSFDVYYNKVRLYNNLVILVKCNSSKFFRTGFMETDLIRFNRTNSNSPYVFGMFSSIKYSFQQSQNTLVGFNDINSIIFSVNECLVIKPKSQRGVNIFNGYPTCFDLFTDNKGHINVNELTRMFNVRSKELKTNKTKLTQSGSNNLTQTKTIDFNISNIEVYKLIDLN